MNKLSILLAVSAASIGTAQAQTIGINFSGGGLSMGSGDEPGVVSGANWNNLTTGSGSGVALMDSSGAMTSALLSFSAAGTYDEFNKPSTANSATNRLYGGGLYGDPTQAEIRVSVSGITYADYDVYVYASADTSHTNTLSISDGSTTFYYASPGSVNSGASNLLLTTSTSSASPTVGKAQYQVFHEHGSSFTLNTFGSAAGVLSNNVFGLQIVATPVPEPASFAVLGLGILPLVRRRKRNRV
ncbi:MAG: PEP-CTERM sorting domain-containing protein [Armatimonadetes bacterium]|nr:PEP-CTERM sorting domain-containing protein [Armatimonadota bacterium]